MRCAAIDGNANPCQRDLDRSRQIERRARCSRGTAYRLTKTPYERVELGTEFVAARMDARAQLRADVVNTDVAQTFDRVLENAVDESTPARMGDRDAGTRRRPENDRRAIGRDHTQGYTGVRRDQRVRRATVVAIDRLPATD
jgi:hypothetical protein